MCFFLVGTGREGARRKGGGGRFFFLIVRTDLLASVSNAAFCPVLVAAGCRRR